MKFATDCRYSIDNQIFWAPYISMASHNAYLAIKHITDSMVKPPEKPDVVSKLAPHDASIIRCLNPQNAADRKSAAYVQRVMMLLDRHFPFLRKMLQYNKENDGKQKGDIKNTDRQLQLLPQDYYSAINLTLKTLAELQNTYVLTTQKSHEIKERELYRYLEVTFDAAVRTIKNRFELNDGEVEHLRKCDSKGNRKRFFKHGFRAENKTSLTIAGLAFFTSLFLDKHHTSLLLKQLPMLHGAPEKAQHASLETYSIYRIILPHRQIEVSDSTTALGLDMLNELQRCPDILFNLLSRDDKALFRVKCDPYNSVSSENLESETLMRRSSNRFPFLAMRFLDTQKIFQKIRFHIDLGTYYFDCYNKTLVDGAVERRYLSSHIKGFGRIQELEAKYKQAANKQSSGDDFESYRTSTNPHYHTNSPLDSQIGIKFSDCEPLLDGGKPDRTSLQPDAWLSLYELPAIVFLTLLPSKSKDEKSAEQLIEEYYSNVRHIFTLVKNEAEELQPYIKKEKTASDFYSQFNISLSQLPDELADYISGNPQHQNPNTEAKKRIQWFIEDSSRRLDSLHKKLDDIRKNQIKLGKPKYPKLNENAMATFLTEDMLRLQPSQLPNGRDKLSSPNYLSLQANLALFGVAEKREQLPQILQKCKLTGQHTPNAHPFLHELDFGAYQKTSELYRAYLQKRKSYFISCLQNRTFGIYALRNAKLEHKAQSGEHYYRQLAEKLLTQPINLPRGLFTDEIVKRLSQLPELKAALSQERVNTVYLIQQYVEQVLKDGSQAFYQVKRHYKFWDKLFYEGMRQPRQYPAVFKHTDNEVLSSLSSMVAEYVKNDPGFRSDQRDKGKHPMLKSLSRFNKDEKTLRLYKVQDMLLFMMAKRLLPNVDKAEAKLSSIMPNGGEGILEQVTSFSLNISFDKEDTWTISQEQMRLKDYGIFRRVISDHRLPRLLPWIDSHKLRYEELIGELRQHSILRLQVFEKGHELEQLLMQHYCADKRVMEDSQKLCGLMLLYYQQHPQRATFTTAEFLQNEMTPELLVKYDPLILTYLAFIDNSYPCRSLLQNEPQLKLGKVAEYLFGQLNKRLDSCLADLQNNNT